MVKEQNNSVEQTNSKSATDTNHEPSSPQKTNHRGKKSTSSSEDKVLTRSEVSAMIARLTKPTVATIAATWDFDNQDANLAFLKLHDDRIVLRFKTDTYRRIPLFKDVTDDRNGRTTKRGTT